MVSIARASYNGEKYVKEQLESILQQDYKDWELIICDDCSSDSTVEIIKEFIQRDSRVRLIINEHNLGFVKNFEKAVKLCNGDYIALCDQDDIWYPNHISKLLAELTKDNATQLVCADARLVNIDNIDQGINYSDKAGLKLIPSDKAKLLYRVLLYNNPFQGASMMMKRNFALSCFPIPEGIKYHDSWFACCAILTNSSAGFKYLSDVLTRYRQHGDNNSGDKLRPRANIIQKVLRIRRVPEMFKSKAIPNTDCVYFIPALLGKYRPAESSEDYKILNRCGKFTNAMILKKNRFVQIVFAWINYSYIVTEKGHPDFLGWFGRWLIV